MIELRPSVRADFDELIAVPLPYRCLALTALDAGKVIGVGGFCFFPDGTARAFVHTAPGAHRYAVTFHRAGLRIMQEARRRGLRRIVATADEKQPRAGPWLARLGFKPQTIAGYEVWVWEDGS